jgi:hypothetical protein
MGTVCCNQYDSTGAAGSGSFGIAYHPLENRVYTTFRSTYNNNSLTMGLVDVCTGGVQYDPALLLNDSLYAMPFTIHPTTGLGYLVRAFMAPYALYTYNFTTKVQTPIAANFSSFVTFGHGRAAAVNPVDTSKLYVVYTQSNAGPSQLVIMDLTSYSLVSVHNLSVTGLYSITFNSSGVAHMFTGSSSTSMVLPMLCYVLDLNTFALTLIATNDNVAHMRPVIALQPSYATCLQRTGVPGRLVITDATGAQAVYQDPDDDALSGGMTVVANAQTFANANPPITILNLAVELPMDAVNTTIDVLVNGTRSGIITFPHVENVYPWNVFGSNAVSNDLIPGTYNVSYFYCSATTQSPTVVSV